MNSEQIKFDASERELATEIKQNPVGDCIFCSNWQHAGEMASCMYKCTHCGERRSRSSITRLINNYSEHNNISFEDCWDMAFNHLKSKQEEYKMSGRIYFDEDYFAMDLTKYFVGRIIGTKSNLLDIRVVNKKRNIFQKLFNL